MNRRNFIHKTGMAGAAVLLSRYSEAAGADSRYPIVRVPENKRRFRSVAVDALVKEISGSIGNREIAWLFGNCFPNTLDTTVDFELNEGRPDTYVITGDIDAMWLRDSSAQVWPYVPLCDKDTALKLLIAGVINRQTKCILKDPYANAFYKNEHKVSEWKKDVTDMKPGVHERKWEVDSLCYPIRLAHGYWKATGDTSPFDGKWQQAMETILQTFSVQTRKDGKGPYHFMRRTENATDTLPMGGYGYPVRYTGMICSMFRPSDDATTFPFLVPSNFFALESLRQLKEMWASPALKYNSVLLNELMDGLDEGLRMHATANSDHGKVYAFEANGYGSYNMMDDANVPSLLSLPYLVPGMKNDDTYQNTRRYVLSTDNPFFFRGAAGEGIGGPHVGMDHIWPLSIIMRGITSDDDTEIKKCLDMLQNTHAGTGFMHESFHKDDAGRFTRKWFAWANTLFGEFVWKVYRERPHLLSA